jgi:hypothetical protein
MKAERVEKHAIAERPYMIRKAKAVWRGTGRAGSGNLSTDSGVLAQTPYSFRTRFENEKGTNPEELIAAARRLLHHGARVWAASLCFSSFSLLSSVCRDRGQRSNGWSPSGWLVCRICWCLSRYELG